MVVIIYVGSFSGRRGRHITVKKQNTYKAMIKHIAMKAKSIRILALAAILTFGLGVHAQTATVHTLPYACGFDTTDLAMLGWTTIDYNNDGYTWTTNGPQNITPHSGSGLVASASYVGGAVGDITPDNFLVSPRIVVAGSAVLSWWHRVANSLYPADHYSVYISTAGNTAADFLATTPVHEYTPTSENYPIWSQVALDLSAYAGDTIYIAFRHHNCFGQYALLLDDVKVETFVSPWSVADTVPWNTTFDTPDTGWTFIGRVNGWYIGAPGAMNGSGGMYVSGDGGATNSYERYSWNNRFHWAARPLHFTDSGDFRVDYDWKCNGHYQCNTYNNQTTCTYYDYVRVMLAPVTAELDTEYFFGYGISTYINNLLPDGWISLSDTNGMRLLANEADWTHHAQSFHVPAAGDYLLLVLSANGNSYTVYEVAPAMDNLSISTLTCPNSIDTIRLTANSNQGLTVSWHDSQASQWAVYVNGSLYGTATDTSYYLAGASWNAATCNVRPRIAVSPICSAGDTALPVNMQAVWKNNITVAGERTVSCENFTLPYGEDFDLYQDDDCHYFGWTNFGEIGQYIENYQSHSGLLSLNMRALNLPSGKKQLLATPRFDAPGNQLLVSFWAKLPTYSGAAADTLFQAGVLFNHDTMDYAHVAANTTPMLTLLGSDANGSWVHYQFTTDALADTTPASITLSLVPHSSSWYECYIDDIEVSFIAAGQDSVPPTVAIAGPFSADAFLDTAIFNATLLNGDTAGLTYTWRSTLTGQSYTGGSQWSMVYSVVGVDTIRVIATNLYGSDTAEHIITVSDNLTVSIRGTATAYVGDTLHYTAVVSGPDTAALSFSWHSTMAAAGLAQFSTLNSQFSIIYNSTGTDTLTLTVSNAHGPHTMTRIVTVLSGCVIDDFPYSEDFEGYYWQDRLACWLIRTPEGLLDNEWRRSNGGNNDGGYYCMYSNGNSTNRAYSAWLITPAIELPQFGDSINFSFALKTQYNDHFAVLVSPTGDPWYDGFTDTLYALDGYTPYLNPWDTLSFSLDNYRGRRIRIAFVHYSESGSLSTARIDDIAITLNELPTHTVSAVSADTTMGTVSGGGEYLDSSVVTLTAIPFDGYEFLHWDDGDTTNPRQVLVTSDTAFTALFRAIEDTVGIDDLSILNSQLSIYPNPSHGDVTVSVSLPSTLTVIDLAGHTVIPPTSINSTFTIHHSSLAPGAYFVRIENSLGVDVKKMTILH